MHEQQSTISSSSIDVHELLLTVVSAFWKLQQKAKDSASDDKAGRAKEAAKSKETEERGKVTKEAKKSQKLHATKEAEEKKDARVSIVRKCRKDKADLGYTIP